MHFLCPVQYKRVTLPAYSAWVAELFAEMD